MKGKVILLILLSISVLTFALPMTSQAADLAEGMTQGDFALWLVKEIGALSKLPPAAQGQDAIDFLISLGIAPEDGWSKDEPVTKEVLASLLDGEDAANLSFEELVDAVTEHVETLLSDRQLAVFKATNPTASGSAPAA